MLYQVNTDAAVDDIRQESGLGVVIRTSSHRLEQQQFISIPYVDNHHAEFLAVQAGLQLVLEIDLRPEDIVVLQTDSKLVADSLDKRYAKHYQAELLPILSMIDQLPLFFVKKIPDRTNREAHLLAQRGMYQTNKKS